MSSKYTDATYQRNVGEFVDREVYANVNSMADYILRRAWEDSDAPFSYDDIKRGTDEHDEQLQYLADYGYIAGEDFDPDDEDTVEDMYRTALQGDEIFEWWLVSPWLLRRLQEYGEPVIEHENLWGRTTTGQAIKLDYVICKIYDDAHA